MQETKILSETIKLTNKDVNVLIFSECTEPNILGLNTTEWLTKACKNFDVKVIDISEDFNEQQEVINNLTNSIVTIVLYSFTPLITQQNIEFYVDYLTYKNLDLVKFPYGYIFKTEYVKRVKQFKEPLLFNGVDNEFVKVQDRQSLNYVTEILKERILEFHIKNGVKFTNPQSVIIHEQVQIESGATIDPFNIITGNSTIKEYAVLKEGNTLKNVIIEKNAVVAKSVIINSFIGEDTIVFPFNTITDSHISENCNIKSYNSIKNAKICENTSVESFNSIGN